MKGGSTVIGPDSKYVVAPVFEEPCTTYADLELDRIMEATCSWTPMVTIHVPTSFTWR